MLVLKNKSDIDIKKAKNLIANLEGIIISTNADDTLERLGEMCILVADNRPVKYLKCITINNKKVFILSDEEIDRIQNALEEEQFFAMHK